MLVVLSAAKQAQHNEHSPVVKVSLAQTMEDAKHHLLTVDEGEEDM